MKNISLLLPALLLFCGSLSAQKAPYNVVIDVTSPDTLVHEAVMRWVHEIIDNHPEAQVEVVYYGKSLGMVNKEKSTVAADVMATAKNKNVKFSVCEVAMKRNQVEPAMLIAGVRLVPDGIYEIVSRQHEGWGYIKASR